MGSRRLCDDFNEKEPLIGLVSTVQDTTGNYNQNVILKYALACIYMSVLFERLAFYSITSNLLLYCTQTLHFNSETALTVFLLFQGCGYFLPIVGGLFGDLCVNRYGYLVFSNILYIIGTSFLLASSGTTNMDIKRGFFFANLTFVTFSLMGHRSNIVAFGVEQIGTTYKAINYYFHGYYFSVNVGAAIGGSIVSYILIQCGFVYGYIIPIASMVLSTAALVIGKMKQFYKLQDNNAVSRENPWHSSISSPRNVILQEGEFQKLLWVIFLLGIPCLFWLAFNQIYTGSLLQGAKMKPISHFFVDINVFVNSVAVLVFIPIALLIYNARKASLLLRIGVGMPIVALATFTAGVVEHYRLQYIAANETVETSMNVTNSSGVADMSELVQLPQYTLCGIGEILTSIAALHFSYVNSPKKLKGFSIGLTSASHGIGSFLDIILTHLTRKTWYTSNINRGHLDYYMFMVGSLLILAIPVYSVVAYRYSKKYRAADNGELDNSLLI